MSTGPVYMTSPNSNVNSNTISNTISNVNSNATLNVNSNNIPTTVPEILSNNEKTVCLVFTCITIVLIVAFVVVYLISYFNKTFLFAPYVPDPSKTKNLVMYNSKENEQLSEEDEKKRRDMIIEAQQRIANES